MVKVKEDLTGWIMSEHGVPDSRLTVIGRAEDMVDKNGKHYSMWICECLCDEHNIITVSQQHLKNGHTKSCGCLRREFSRNNKQMKSKKYRDLTNEVFGYLKVIGFDTVKNRRAYWKCVCKCGNEISARGDSLTSGCILSCGCYHSEIKTANLIGKRFGLLTVKERVGSDSNGRVQWFCLCDCGNTKIVSSNNLQSGDTKSCGCLQSWMENQINKLLNSNNIKFETQYSFDDLYYKSSSYLLRFDFGILNNNNNIVGLIEYNGIQHYESGYYSDDDELFERDKMKIEYCNRNMIPLLVLNKDNYDEKYILDWIGNLYDE